MLKQDEHYSAKVHVERVPDYKLRDSRSASISRQLEVGLVRLRIVFTHAPKHFLKRGGALVMINHRLLTENQCQLRQWYIQ